MYSKSIALAVGVFFVMGSASNADEIEWRYFASPRLADGIEGGRTGYLTCAHPLWEETVTEATKSILRRHSRLEFPEIPDPEEASYQCMGAAGADVVAVNWTLVETERDAPQYAEKITATGLREALLHGSRVTVRMQLS